MPYGMGFGRGRGLGFGRGFGRGFGFRGYSPPWPYVGRGRGGLPRGWAYNLYYPYAGYPYAGAYQYYGGAYPYFTPWTW